MAKKDKSAKGKAGKAGKQKAPRDWVARLLGSIAALPLIVAACYLLATGRIELVQAGQLAAAALVLELLVEKAVVPLGRFLIGPPRQ